MPFFIAERQGYYRDEGLDVQLIEMKGEIAVKAAVAGSTDYTAAAGGSLSAILRGVKLRVVMVLSDRPSDIDVVAQPSVKTFADLKGKTFSMSGHGDFVHMLTRKVLSQNGLDAEKDVTLMVLGGNTDRLAALKGGSTQATLLSPPHNYMAVQQGFTKLASVGEFVRLVYGGVVASEKKLTSRPDEVAAVLRATVKGLRYYRERRTDTIRLITETLKVDPRTADLMWSGTRAGMTEDGTLDEATMRLVIADIAKAIKSDRTHAPGEVFDFGPITRVNQDLLRANWRP
jgi:NitT/TauT family transport system substrate-binding protein